MKWATFLCVSHPYLFHFMSSLILYLPQMFLTSLAQPGKTSAEDLAQFSYVLSLWGKENTKSCISKKKKIPPLKKATITSFEIEPFPIANLKNHKCCASCIFWVYWLRTLTNNLFSIALPPEVLWRCCTTWSPGSLWSPSSPPYCEPSDLLPWSRYHLLLPCELFNLFIY